MTGTGDNIGTTAWIYNPFGIVITNLSTGLSIYYNSINLYGAGPTYSTPTGSAGLIVDVNCSDINFKDNVIKNEMTGTGLYKAFGIYLRAAVSPFNEIDYNDYYVNSVNPSFTGYFNGEDTTLTQWQAAIGADANTISAAPLFMADEDMRPQENSPLLNAGIPIAGFTVDILGEARNASTPTIGAYENAVILLPAAPSDLTAIGDTNIVEFQWVDNSSNELGFVIERRLGDTTSVNPFEVIDTVAADVQDYMDINVDPLTTYTYRLYAYNAEGVSPYSNIAQATTPVPVELTSFTAKVGDNSVSLSGFYCN